MAIITSYPTVVPKTIDRLIISQAYDIDADEPIVGNPTGSVTVGSIVDLVNTGLIPGTGTVTSVGVSTPSAFTVSNSPITSAGVINITGSGTSVQYVDGTGALQNSELILNRDSASNTLGNKTIPSDFNFASIPASYANSIWNIVHYHDLGSTSITLPANVTLNFIGGKFSNGTLTGNNTKIKSALVNIFDTNVSFTGTWELVNVNPIWFGSSLNTNEIQKANELCSLSNGSISITNDYVLNTVLLLSNSISSKNKNKLSGTGLILRVNADNVTIDNIEIEGINKSGAGDADSIICNSNNFKLFNSKITDLRFNFQAESLVEYGNVIIKNNTFNSDFTAFTNLTIQNDIIVLRGVKNVKIINNTFNIVKCNRVFKLADNLSAPSGTEVSSFPCEDIFISSNVINASANGNSKQLLDGFNALKSLSFSSNNIYSRGFSTVIEDKTGHIQNYTRVHKIFDNDIDLDGSFVVESGNYGSSVTGYESGFQIVEVYNNTINRQNSATSNLDEPTLTAKFMNSTIFSNNNIVTDATFNAYSVIEHSSSETVVISNNTITNGTIKLNRSVSDQQGNAFNAVYKTIKIIANNILEYDAADGAILLLSIRSSLCRVDIFNNTIKLLNPQVNTLGTPVYLKDSDFLIANIYNNTSFNFNNSNNDYLRLLTINGTVKDFGNSWNTDVASLVSETSFTVAAQTSVFKIYAFSGIKFLDNVSFNMSEKIGAVIAKGEYNTTNQCIIYYFNPLLTTATIPALNIQLEADRSSSGVYTYVR